MTTLKVTLELPNCLAREADAAGLLTPKALRELVKDNLQCHAAQALLAGAARGSRTKGKPLSMKVIQAEVGAVRRARRTGNIGAE